MALIRGKDVKIYLYDGSMWKPAVCLKTCSLRTTREAIETSIEGSGNNRTFVYGGATWEGTANGVTSLLNVNAFTLPDFRTAQAADQLPLMRYERLDISGNAYTEEGNALILDVYDEGDQNSMNDFAIQLKGSGGLTRIYTPTPINPNAKVKRFEYTAVGGQNFFTSALLNGKDVLLVDIDGVGYSKIITSGTPVEKEAKYTSSGGLGRIQVPPTIPAGTECYVLYQDI